MDKWNTNYFARRWKLKLAYLKVIKTGKWNTQM